MTRHYLDHASSSPLRPEAAEAVRASLELPTAAPGRLHHEAQQVRTAIEVAREDVAALFGVAPRQVVFTSGATEAINTAVFGATRRRPGAPVLLARVEHAAVRAASERQAPVVTVPVEATGRVSLDALAVALASHPGAALLHCQAANHEVGTLQPVAEAVRLAREAGILVHVDAAAAAGHVPLDLAGLGADLVSLSAHKFGGPPGVGALVLRRGLRLEPLVVGGDEERGRRAGMENVAGIVGFGAAARALAADGGARLFAEAHRAQKQVQRLVDAATALPGVDLVGEAQPDGRLPHLVCLGIEGVEAEPVLLSLDQRGIAVHSGSACASESFAPSPVLEAMGVDPSHSLRPSVGWSTTDDDVDAFVAALPEVVGELQALRS